MMLQSNSWSRSSNQMDTKLWRSLRDSRKHRDFKSSCRSHSKYSLGKWSFQEGKVCSPGAQFRNSPQLAEVNGIQKLPHSPSAQAAFPPKLCVPYASAEQLSRSKWETVTPGDRAQAWQKGKKAIHPEVAVTSYTTKVRSPTCAMQLVTLSTRTESPWICQKLPQI